MGSDLTGSVGLALLPPTVQRGCHWWCLFPVLHVTLLLPCDSGSQDHPYPKLRGAEMPCLVQGLGHPSGNLCFSQMFYFPLNHRGVFVLVSLQYLLFCLWCKSSRFYVRLYRVCFL